MDEYAMNSNHRRAMATNNNHRRSSIGCTSDLKGKYSSSPQHSPEQEDATEVDELSECSTIISSMEMSASSLLSNDKSSKSGSRGSSKKKDSRNKGSKESKVSFENDGDSSPNEDDSSERAFKDSIFHQYCTSYQSPTPSPTGKSLKQKLRFTDAISPAPLSPRQQRPNNSDSPVQITVQDRRKMMSRWASTGHICPSDDECDPADKATRDSGLETLTRNIASGMGSDILLVFRGQGMTARLNS